MASWNKVNASHRERINADKESLLLSTLDFMNERKRHVSVTDKVVRQIQKRIVKNIHKDEIATLLSGMGWTPEGDDPTKWSLQLAENLWYDSD